eukprot:GHUV01019176.1.p1 GENE.GHUV01019176.1~~GHUV01019176.1.p1  ORF type:complete len:219 (+),score=79.96 GHUV01019176.1:857-1513(+)
MQRRILAAQVCACAGDDVYLLALSHHPSQDGTEKSRQIFITVPTEVGQTEAEEIGVEHLLRNVKDATISTLASDVSAKLQALKGLRSRLADVQEYLAAVLDGRLPVNNDIMTYLQDVFNLLPNMNVEALSTSLAVKGNDMMSTIYLASLIRSILALHKLINNKEQRMWNEKEKAEKAKAAAAKAKTDKDGAKDADADKENKAVTADGKEEKPQSNGNA